MRSVVSRVTEAAVLVDDQLVGELDGPGLLVLLAVAHDDGPAQAETMARKLGELRILRGERSVADAGAGVLLISQFTLYAATRKGRRPSYTAAARPAHAEPLVEEVVAGSGPAGSPWPPAASARQWPSAAWPTARSRSSSTSDAVGELPTRAMNPLTGSQP
jgi:D-tyrosyl-tRNA(Tyr) deacylase